MFADELAGNSSRKRAEENKARRLRLKAQQQKKANGKVTSPTPALVADDVASLAEASSNLSIEHSTSSIAKDVSIATVAPKTVTASAQLSAVEKAEQQRQIRAETTKKIHASIAIQRVYRRYYCNIALRNHHVELISKRTQDINTLREMLFHTKNIKYVPPPTTVTAMVRQLLFLTTRTRYYDKTKMRMRVKRIDSLRQLDLLANLVNDVLLPGISSIDEKVNPMLSWLATQEGRNRLKQFLLVVMVAISSKKTNGNALDSLLNFLRSVLGLSKDTSAPKQVQDYCWSLLFPNSPPIYDSSQSDDPPYASESSDLGFISILRYFLLFISAGADPIPPDAMNAREACIPETSKKQGGELFLIILHAVNRAPMSHRRVFQSQIVTMLMTVPLFTWKISSAALNVFLDANGASTKAPMIQLIESFMEPGSIDLSNGYVNTVLTTQDLTLTRCPATPSQCLLANIVQLGRVCPTTSGIDTDLFDFKSAAILFSVISTLVEAIPVGTFTARESCVEWIDDGHGVHKPVVLSPVVIEQCKALLVDSHVRRMFTITIDTDILKTNEVLQKKDEKDLKLEDEMMKEGTTSAAALAAREARIDRSKSFWNSSKWARKLTKGVANFLVKDGDASTKGVMNTDKMGTNGLKNYSSESRRYAEGSFSKGSESTVERSTYMRDLLFCLTRTYAIVIARWGGGGKNDIVQRKQLDRAKGEQEVATSSVEPCVISLLNTLCFGTTLLKVLWAMTQCDSQTVAELHSVIEPDKGRIPVRMLQTKPATICDSRCDGWTLLFLFVSLLGHVLIVTDDVELYDMDKPLPIHQIRRCIQLLKKLLYRACCLDDLSTVQSSTYFGLALITASSKAMKDLYDRSSRRPLCTPKLWIVADLLESEIRSCKRHGDFASLLNLPVLRICPFLVSFKRRLKLFECIITTSRVEIQGVNDVNPFNTNPLKKGIPVRITRARILEDGLATMNNLGSNMRQRIVVNYYNEAGVRETGVDAGGLFKEFWTDLCAIAFDPNYALFRVTDGAGDCMYPNPSSAAAHGTDHITLFEFLGRILGKALFEGITIHPRFAHFFLSFLRGDYNYLHMLPDLSTVDPQLYNNLMFLKTYDGDARDLCLSFTVTTDDFGGTKEIPLVPKGDTLEVTNANKLRYIGLVAKYYVVDRVKEQSEAFTRGLWEVIDRSWLRIFNEPELQVLISGASDGKLDVEDMKANTRYVGGFTGLDRTVARFWNVVARFDSKQQADLLRFVTSCERPPPLGFGSMNPPFTIQRVGILRDGDKLPTASTCFNILKLPTYSSEKVLRDRLLLAIQSGAGFELA
jgi:ubiquitin-protein ligase E3 C